MSMDFDKILEEAAKNRDKRAEELVSGLLGKESPHMHPPSTDRCTCSNKSRFRIAIKPQTGTKTK